MDEVYNSVFSAKLVRESQMVNFQFCSANEKAGLLVLRTSVTYRLKNLSSEEAKHQLQPYFVNVSTSPELKDQFTDLVISYPTDGKKKPVSLNRGLIDKCLFKDTPAKDNDGAQSSKTAEICGDDGKCLATIKVDGDGFRQHLRLKEPLTIPPGQEVEVTYAYERVKRFSDMVVVVTTQPVKTFTVSAVLCDASVAGLVLEADAAHRLGPQIVSLVDKGNRHTEWRFPTAVLPGQGFELHWYPKNQRPG
jgi:hypothetical protein